jgi:hypothetical protein
MRRILAITLTVAALVLVLTACGSSSAGDKGTSKAERAALDFAQCMRENGLPSFPDPVPGPDGTFRLQRPAGVSTSQLDAALANCKSEAQAAGLDSGSSAADTSVQDQLLKLSRCMRANGIPEFPDPKGGSDLMTGLHEMFGDYDLNSPRVSKALNGCNSIVNQLLGEGH